MQTITQIITSKYDKSSGNLQDKISCALETIDPTQLTLEEMKEVSSIIIELETAELQNDVEELLAKKESIERELERKSEELQQSKYSIFNALEHTLKKDTLSLSKLHQIKLQSIDLYDILSEMVESALITALEKDSDITDATIEVIKEITFESIKEGSLSTIRVRKILSTILITAIDIAEATPNRAQSILRSTLKGMRTGLVNSIDRFKKRLEFMPLEAKHILIEDYDTIMEDLHQTDILFSQVISTQAQESSTEIKNILLGINKDMHYDLEELVHISKETAEVMKARFSDFARNAVKKADLAFKSSKAQEAKRMGIEAFGIAKIALGTAIKSAKDAMDKK